VSRVALGEEGVPLRRLVETLGPAVVRVLSTPGLDDAFVRDVVVHDPVGPPALQAGDVVLGVGVRPDSPEGVALAQAVGRAGAVALVVRSPDRDLTPLRAAAADAGVTLLVLPAAMRWEQASVLMRNAVTAASPPSGGLGEVGDLFGFANVLAGAIGGAITIEDSASRVLAYSTSDDDELDGPRREAILGRRVPETYLDHLRQRGVLRALQTSDEVVELEADARLGLRRRLAIAVRADTEVLGTLWALEGKVPLREKAADALRDAARVAGGHLLRAQGAASALRQHREDVLRHLLENRVDAATAAETLGFDPGLPAAVIGVALDSRGPLPADHHAYRRLDELLSARAMAFRWHVSATLAGPRMLALLPELTGDGEQQELGIRRLAEGLVADAEQAGLRVRVACGPVVPALGEVGASTAAVDEVLRCLAANPGRGPVASPDDVRALISVENALTALAEVPGLWVGPVDRLLRYDAQRGTDYADTLRAWLDGFGDSAAVAAALKVHRNTLRYRLERIAQISGLQLGDPEERLIAALHLRRAAPAVRRGATPAR
jgi:sugar diacid utilization regulator